jgi:hypothetical protein
MAAPARSGATSSPIRHSGQARELLNEFLKEHREVAQLESTVASLVATVKEQASQIQKVSV